MSSIENEFNRKLQQMKKKIIIASAIVAVLLGTVGFTLQKESMFEVAKNIELLGKIYRTISADYVDDIDASQFMRAGIDGMLTTLDPYTVFMDEEESEDIDQITTGRYAGIGVTVGGDADGNVMIMSITEGYAADKSGMRIGDIIVEVDGKNVRGKTLSEVRTVIKGDAETELKLKVEREGEKKPIDFTLIRKEIIIKNVPFYSLVEGNIGYLRLERFSANASEEIGGAIRNLQDSAKAKNIVMRGIVLDLRGNPGGLLDAAVNITGKFVDQGSVIVTTRGRDTARVRSYTSPSAPLLPEIPLAVLINNNSASASEIVAGAVQDLDRGVVVGERSFGKGLVQTISRMPYNTSLKITTAKYYTPSGRLIQEIDYFQRNRREGKRSVFKVQHDTAHKAFKTKGGRTVYDGGGIMPDVVVKDPQSTALENALYRRSMFLRFANAYRGRNNVLPPAFKADDRLLGEFKAYLDKEKFTYDSDAEKSLSEIADISEKSSYSDAVVKKLAELKLSLGDEKTKDFDRQKENLLAILEREIITRYRGEDAGLAVSLKSDGDLKEALTILKDKERYQAYLAKGHEVGKSAPLPSRKRAKSKKQ
jgi:carboxyl-terminal processing protease